MRFSILFSITVLTACISTRPPAPTATPHTTIPVDARGCLQNEILEPLPQKPKSIDESSAVKYYEDLEWHYLHTAERCLSRTEHCDAFIQISKTLRTALLESSQNNADTLLAVKNSNNKLIAMMAINSLAYEKKYLKKLHLEQWLTSQTNKNDLSQKNDSIRVASENKKYPFHAHNMASTSARAFMFVGLYTKNVRWQQKAIAHMSHTLKSVRFDGSLPLEARRGARALRYSLQVLSDLVAITTFSDRAVWNKNKNILLKMAAFDLAVLENNTLMEVYAKENVFPGPIQDFQKQEISSLRSRLAWLELLKAWDAPLDAQGIKIDKRSCSEDIMKEKPECGYVLQTVGDVLKSPLGFTLGFNPKCVSVQALR